MKSALRRVREVAGKSSQGRIVFALDGDQPLLAVKHSPPGDGFLPF